MKFIVNYLYFCFLTDVSVMCISVDKTDFSVYLDCHTFYKVFLVDDEKTYLYYFSSLQAMHFCPFHLFRSLPYLWSVGGYGWAQEVVLFSPSHCHSVSLCSWSFQYFHICPKINRNAVIV